MSRLLTNSQIRDLAQVAFPKWTIVGPHSATDAVTDETTSILTLTVPFTRGGFMFTIPLPRDKTFAPAVTGDDLSNILRNHVAIIREQLDTLAEARP